MYYQMLVVDRKLLYIDLRSESFFLNFCVWTKILINILAMKILGENLVFVPYLLYVHKDYPHIYISLRNTIQNLYLKVSHYTVFFVFIV